MAQDFHLAVAKRHYNFALETIMEAHLWFIDPDQIAGRRDLDKGPATTGSPTPKTGKDLLVEVEDDGPWYMGKAQEEFN